MGGDRLCSQDEWKVLLGRGPIPPLKTEEEDTEIQRRLLLSVVFAEKGGYGVRRITMLSILK